MELKTLAPSPVSGLVPKIALSRIEKTMLLKNGEKHEPPVFGAALLVLRIRHILKGRP